MRFKGLSFESVDCCAFCGSEGAGSGCRDGARKGWFTSFTGHAEGFEGSEDLLKGEDLESDLCIGHDGGGFALATGAGVRLGAWEGTSLQNQPMVASDEYFCYCRDTEIDCEVEAPHEGRRQTSQQEGSLI